jgi:hypothetical protein
MNNKGSSWKKKEVKKYIGLQELENKSKVNNLNTICYNKKMAFALTSQLTQYQSVGDIDSSKFLIQDNSFL